MKKIFGYILVVVMLSACGGDLPEGELPVMSKDYLDAVTSLSLAGEGEEKNVDITANCDWTVSSDVSWLSVSPSSGSKNQTITITATANKSGDNRTGTVIIRSGQYVQRKMTISQTKLENSSQIPGPDDNIPPE